MIVLNQNNSNWFKDFQNEWQIDNKQFCFDSITTPGILSNQFLLPPQKRFADSNCRKHIFTVRADQLLSLKLDRLTFFNCYFPLNYKAVQVLHSCMVGLYQGPWEETIGLLYNLCTQSAQYLIWNPVVLKDSADGTRYFRQAWKISQK